jgi:quinol monooxygenase YgiN
MIVVNAVVKSTQDDIVALQGAICAMEAASRAEEGCLDYTFSVELNDTAVLRITEKWVSLDDLKAHFATPHMADFQAAVAQHPPESMEVRCYEATEVDPF